MEEKAPGDIAGGRCLTAAGEGCVTPGEIYNRRVYLIELELI